MDNKHKISVNNAAFTLFELAVVLVILALLVGGVIIGSSMLKAQRLRQVSMDANGYILAFYQFKQKYGEIPGDFAGATAVWGRADGVAGAANCTNPNYTQSADGKTTCNGDGDGILNWTAAAVQQPHEATRTWQHMAAAGIIVGKFKGTRYTSALGSSGSWPYATLPGAKYGEGSVNPGNIVPDGPVLTKPIAYAWLGGAAIVDNVSVADDLFYDGDYTNALMTVKKSSGEIFGNDSMTPLELSQIDQKSDDGFPATGFIRATKTYAAGNRYCTTSSASNATYDFSRHTWSLFANTYEADWCGGIFMTSLKGNDSR